MAVGSNQRIGIGRGHRLALHLVRARPYCLGKIFQIHLMADAGARRHHTEIVKRPLSPFQESVTLAIPAIFHLDVFLEGAG